MFRSGCSPCPGRSQISLKFEMVDDEVFSTVKASVTIFIVVIPDLILRDPKRPHGHDVADD